MCFFCCFFVKAHSSDKVTPLLISVVRVIVTGSFADVTYDRTHFTPQADEGRTHQFSTEFDLKKSRKILVNSTQP